MAEQLKERVEELEREGARKTATIRVLVARKGGIEALDADLADKVRQAGAGDRVEDDVHPLLLLPFFEEAVAAIGSEELKDELRASLEGQPAGDAGMQPRMEIVRKRLDKLYTDIWLRYNVDDNAASKAVENAGYATASDDLDESEQDQLNELIDAFQEAEQTTVGSMVLGEEEFAQRLAQRDRFERIQLELEAKMASLDGNEQGLREFFMELQTEVTKVQEKIRAMGTEEASAFLENPPLEDEAKMMRFQALQSILTGGQGGHGHSHGGQPCGGHGHSHGAAPPAPAHGHSHGGQPCGGHGHSHDAAPEPEAHGHSHGGKPCHGHGP